jgi:hypothetical protein
MRAKEINFIKWSQKNTCLFCNYPLDLYKHLHHIIAKDDGGPNHYLNLVALCPNHHFLIERIKRYIIPNQRNPSDKRLKSGTAALNIYHELSEELRRIVDILTKPLRMPNAIKKGIPDNLKRKAAEDLMEEDVKILDTINKKRPRIFLPFNFLGTVDDSIDVKAGEVANQIGTGIYLEITIMHMNSLNLPYMAV